MGWGPFMSAIGGAARGPLHTFTSGPLGRPVAPAVSGAGMGGSMVAPMLAQFLQRRHGGAPSSPGAAQAAGGGAQGFASLFRNQREPGGMLAGTGAGPMNSLVQPQSGPGSVQDQIERMMLRGQFSDNPLIQMLMYWKDQQDPSRNIMW